MFDPAPDGPPLSPYHTAVRCAFLVTAHHGRRLLPEQLVGIEADDPLRSMVRVLRGASFECRTLNRRKWKDIVGLGKAFPTMAVYKNGRWVILVGLMGDEPGGAAAAVLDPTKEKAGLQLVPRADFEEVWSGTLILCKPKVGASEEDQPFGLR